MANINTANIENFDSMTAEEKVNALLSVEIPEAPDMSGYVLKSVLDRKASEAASLTKQLREKEEALRATMSEAQKKQLAEEDERKAAAKEREELEEKYRAAVRELTVGKYMAGFTALEMDEKTAEAMSNALVDGDGNKACATLKKFMDDWKSSCKKAIEADLLKNMTTPTGGVAGGVAGDPEVEFVMNRARERAEIAKRAEEARKHYQNNI